jgi:hypothetical protein
MKYYKQTIFDIISAKDENNTIINEILAKLNPWVFPQYVFHDYTNVLSKEKIREIVTKLVELGIVKIEGKVHYGFNYPLILTSLGRLILSRSNWILFAEKAGYRNEVRLFYSNCDSVLFKVLTLGFANEGTLKNPSGLASLSPDAYNELKAKLVTDDKLIYLYEKDYYLLTSKGYEMLENGGYQIWYRLVPCPHSEDSEINEQNSSELNNFNRIEIAKEIADKLIKDKGDRPDLISEKLKISGVNLKQNYNINNTKMQLVFNLYDIEEELIKKVALDCEIDINKYFIENYKEQKGEQNEVQKAEQSMKKIFLSHSTKDKDIIDKIIELLEIIGVKEENIFYSSKPYYGAKLGENFLDRIKKEINEDTLVISFLSQNYYKSEICLCEMGAAWAKTEKRQAILIPPFDFGDIKGVIPNTTLSMKVNDSLRLNELKELIEKELHLVPINQNKWEERKVKILKEIENLLTYQ